MTMSAALVPFAVQPDEGEVLETPTRDRVVVKVDTAQSHGSMTVLEFHVDAGSGPAVHSHLREDELWWVLEGEFRFRVGDTWLSTTSGGLAFGPKRMPHAFQNVGDSPGRLLVVTTPSGLERFFYEFAELPDTERLAAVGERNWLAFSGPPLSVSDPL
jgi:mannose-6-phosphate isomerase-like protein (cupin superfamily)